MDAYLGVICFNTAEAAKDNVEDADLVEGHDQARTTRASS